jgi:hypothetical protein
MKRIGSWRRLAGRCLLAAGLAGAPGCLQFLNPVHPPAAEVVEPCQAVPLCSRKHVYIFLANGVDPLCLGNLSGVREYLHCLGFTKTYYGQVYHTHWFRRELQRAHREDPEARFVLIGYGCGVDTARALVRSACQDGIPIELVLSLKGKPEGCLAAGPLADVVVAGAEGQGAPRPLPEERLLGSPTDPGTLQLLAAELTQVAAQIPIPQPPPLPGSGPVPETAPKPRPQTAPETGPMPRPVEPGEASAAASQRDALKPVGQLQTFDLERALARPVPAVIEPQGDAEGDAAGELIRRDEDR